MLVQIDNKSGVSFESIFSSDWLGAFKSYECEMLKSPDNSFRYKDSYAYAIGIIPTNRCNLRCIYCYSETGDVIEQDLSIGQVDTIINMLVKNASIHRLAGESNVNCKLSFCGGGEPTFSNDIFKYAVRSLKKKCSDNNLECTTLLITNGVMSDDMISFVLQNVDQVNISFDCNESIQNRQRPTANKSASFPLVQKTLRAFIKEQKHIYIRSTILPTEFSKIKEIAVDIFTQYPIVDVFHVEPLYCVGRGKRLDEPTENSLLHFMHSYVGAYQYVSECYSNKRLFNSSFQYQLQNFGCGAAIGINPWVHMDGNILPCTEYLKDPCYSIGRVYSDRIEYNEHYTTLAENQSQCKKCFAFYQCGGGCARNILKDNRGFCKDTYSKAYCNMTKSFWSLAFNELINNKPICGMTPVEIDVSRIKCIKKACLIATDKEEKDYDINKQ